MEYQREGRWWSTLKIKRGEVQSDARDFFYFFLVVGNEEAESWT